MPKQLIQKRPSLLTTPHGRTKEPLLFYSIKFGNVEMTLFLLAVAKLLNIDLESIQNTQTGNTLLHTATNPRIINFLLNYDINLVKSVNSKGRTPLHAIADKVNPSNAAKLAPSIKLLLDKGADKLAMDFNSETPFMILNSKPGASSSIALQPILTMLSSSASDMWS